MKRFGKKLFVFAIVLLLSLGLAAAASALTLNVSLPEGGTAALDNVQPEDLIGTVKARLASEYGVQTDGYDLLLNGGVLSDGDTVADCGIQDGSTAELAAQATRAAGTKSSPATVIDNYVEVNGNGAWIGGNWANDIATTHQVDGDIQYTLTNNSDYGLEYDFYSNPESDFVPTITVTGSVSMNSGDYSEISGIGAVGAYSEGNGAEVTVEQNVTATVHVTNQTIAYAAEVDIWGESSDTNVSIDVDIGGNATVDVDIDKQTGGQAGKPSVAYGIDADTECPNGEITVHVGGDVTADIDAKNSNDQNNRVQAYGVTSEMFGADAAVTVNVDGDVTAKSTLEAGTCLTYAGGVVLNPHEGVMGTTVNVGGDVTAAVSGGNGTAEGLKLDTDGGTVNVTVAGDVTASGGTSSSTSGLVVDANSGTQTNVVIGGTLSSTNGSAVVMNNSTSVLGDNVSLTVWALEAGENKQLVSVNGQEAGADGKDPVEAAEEAINYIVKTVAGSLLNFDSLFTDGENEVTIGEEKYHTVRQGGDVTLSFTLEEDEVLDGIYYNAEKEDSLVAADQLETSGSGQWLMKMLRGGGMLLGVKTHKHEYEYTKPIVEATCTEGGKDLHTCKYCSATIEVETEATGHTPGDAVREKEVKAQVGVAGSYDEVVYCTACKAELSRKTVKTDPLPESETDPEEEKEEESEQEPEEIKEPEPEKKPEQEPEPDPEEESDDEDEPAVYEILRIKDLEEKMEIIFFSDGTYTAKPKDGKEETGRFGLNKDKDLVLVNDGDPEKTEFAVKLKEENTEEPVYGMTFIPADELKKENPRTYEFELKPEDVQRLKSFC